MGGESLVLYQPVMRTSGWLSLCLQSRAVGSLVLSRRHLLFSCPQYGGFGSSRMLSRGYVMDAISPAAVFLLHCPKWAEGMLVERVFSIEDATPSHMLPRRLPFACQWPGSRESGTVSSKENKVAIWPNQPWHIWYPWAKYIAVPNKMVLLLTKKSEVILHIWAVSVLILKHITELWEAAAWKLWGCIQSLCWWKGSWGFSSGWCWHNELLLFLRKIILQAMSLGGPL